MTDLVVMSLERWDDVWRRNQHLVAGLLDDRPHAARAVRRAGRRPAARRRVATAPVRGRAVAEIPGVAPGRLWRYRPVKWLPRRTRRARRRTPRRAR